MTLGNKQPLNWRTFFICVVISFGQFVGAYESTIIGTTLQKTDFMQRMGLWDSNGNETHRYSALEGAIVGLFQAGAVFGSIVVTVVMERWGRKAGLLFGSVLSLPGLAGMTGSMNVEEFLVFRFIAGLGTWACGTAASVYIPELAPPAYRGFFAGLNGIMIGLGLTTASYVGMGLYFSDNEVAAWRVPMGIPLIAPILILCALPFLPESPRFLLLNDKPEESRRVFNKLNASPLADLSQIEEEWKQMEQQAAYDRVMDASWKNLFTRPTYRKRVIISCTLTFLNQCTGVFVINNYGQTFYQTLGFSPAARQLLQGNRDILALLGNLLGSSFIDRVGRKPLLLFSFSGCLICIVLEAVMVNQYAYADNVAGKNAGVAFLYLFLFFYASGIDVGTYVYLGEMFPNHIRVKGVGLALGSLNVTATILLSVTSIAFSAIGWKFFLIFAALTACGIVWIVFCIPETRRLPLEEIEAIFGNSEDIMVFTSSENRGLEADCPGAKAAAEHIE